MSTEVEPIQILSLKDACTSQLSMMILAGQLRIGERLPPERRLAASLNVSRPVVHQAIVDLAAKGLVEIVPRKGVFVCDFRTSGSCSLLATLLEYHEGDLDTAFFGSLADMRLLMETETARLAALHRGKEQLDRLSAILVQEAMADRSEAQGLAELDFTFHQMVALASGNLMYPLIINSFRPVYTNLTRRFFARHQGNCVLDQVFEYHGHLVNAIDQRDSERASRIMGDLLRHGTEHM